MSTRKLPLIIFMSVFLLSCGKESINKNEKLKTLKTSNFGLNIDVPESWNITEDSEFSIEISRGGKGDGRLFYIKPADGIEGSEATTTMLTNAVEKKDGFKLVEEIKIKNGIGIKYEDKPGKNINKNYWFIITAQGKTYSVENGMYNDDGKYFDLEKAAIESIR